jgi:translocation and assembly module TamA
MEISSEENADVSLFPNPRDEYPRGGGTDCRRQPTKIAGHIGYSCRRMNQTVFALVIAVALSVTAPFSVAHAADPQPYRVEIASVGNGDMDSTLKATSDLQSLRGTAPVSPFGLIARARSDVDRLKTALESYGYYQGSVAIKINGLSVTNPGLGDALTALPSGKDAQVQVSFALGPLYHLGRIDVDGDLPEAIRGALGLKTGQPAVASAVLEGGARMLTALQEQGYAFATVDPPVAYESADAPVLDLRFNAVMGPKVNIGAVHFEGLKRVHESLLRDRLLLHTGQPYSSSAVERARRDLLALGVFSQVSLSMGTAVDESGGVPITFKLRERLRHTFSAGAAYSSDLGGSGTVKWSNRDVFGGAQQFSISASVLNLGGSDTTGTGYDTTATYLMPDFGHRNQSLQFAVSALKQSLQAYDQTARTSTVTLARKLSSIWTVSVGGATTDEQIMQNGETHFYTLFALPLTVAYDSTNLASPLEDPRHGIRASVSLTPTLALGHPNSKFLISRVNVAKYFDLNHLLPIEPGRTVLAARALAGIAQGAGELSLPPDQRFYGGGSGTIRGYQYQSVGPKFPVGDKAAGLPIGGTAITAASVELRQRFGANLGAAFFMDAGQVSGSLRAVPDQFSIGVGAGVRYYTPIGPIRFDIAVPTKRMDSQQDKFEFYIGLGQSF